MKYSTIIDLMNGGIQAISSRTLDIGDSYTVVKFKSAIKKAFTQYQEKEDQMLKEAGIKDTQSFFTKHNELLAKKYKDAIDEGLLEENKKKIDRFNALQSEARKEDVTLDSFDPLTFEAWRLLQECNKDVKFGSGVELLPAFEVELEGVLWKMKDEKKENKA